MLHKPASAPAELRVALDAIPDSAWNVSPDLSSDTEIRSWTQVDIGGRLTTVWRTQVVAEDVLIEANRQSFNDSEGKRWGDGRMVARIPLNVLFDPTRDIAAKLREGDRDHLGHWLDSEDARPFRTFKGRIT